MGREEESSIAVHVPSVSSHILLRPEGAGQRRAQPVDPILSRLIPDDLRGRRVVGWRGAIPTHHRRRVAWATTGQVNVMRLANNTIHPGRVQWIAVYMTNLGRGRSLSSQSRRRCNYCRRAWRRGPLAARRVPRAAVLRRKAGSVQPCFSDRRTASPAVPETSSPHHSKQPHSPTPAPGSSRQQSDASATYRPAVWQP